MIEEYHADFEKAAVRLKLNLQYIGDIGAYDYEKHKAEEALDHLKEYFRNSIAHSRTNPFKDDKEIEDFFVSIKPQFIDSYAKKEIIFKKLLRTEVPKETLGESSAPVLW